FNYYCNKRAYFWKNYSVGIRLHFRRMEDEIYWEKAGLLKPSVVRTSKITSIHGTELKRHLGELHRHDLENALNMCRKLFKCFVISFAIRTFNVTKNEGE